MINLHFNYFLDFGVLQCKYFTCFISRFLNLTNYISFLDCRVQKNIPEWRTYKHFEELFMCLLADIDGCRYVLELFCSLLVLCLSVFVLWFLHKLIYYYSWYKFNLWGVWVTSHICDNILKFHGENWLMIRKWSIAWRKFEEINYIVVTHCRHLL